jgi:hypothetical protein
MAWDSSRPVPWQRLVRDWLIYVGIMAVVFIVFYRDRLNAGLIIGLLISGPLFVGFGALLAKFGYQRKTLRDLRTETTQRQAEAATSPSDAAGRPKPPPTKRTSTGPSQHAKKGKGRRR